MREQYADRQILAINNELSELQLTYDTRTLAAAMMVRSCHMLRMLLGEGIWSKEDVLNVIVEATKDVMLPLERDVETLYKNDPTDSTKPAAGPTCNGFKAPGE